MKILVTGACGFIGSHLSERLMDLGHTVVGIDNFNDYYSLKLKKLNRQDLENKGVEIHKLDLSEDNLEDLVKDIDIVYHLAAQPGISSKVPFEKYVKNNITATFKLAELLRDSDSLKLFVNIATSSVYGSHATDTEDIVPKPTSFYGVTKLCAEQLVLSYQREFNFPACSVRPFSIYGERERPEKLYPKLIHSILNNEKFPLYEGSKEHLRSYTYIGDLIDGLVLILENKDKCMGEIFNFGIDSTITTGEGIEIVENVIGRKTEFDIIPRRVGDQAETKANIDKARSILGYNPTTAPEEGLKKEVEWFKEKIFNAGINLYE